jgi:hypothetical protein
MISSAQEFVELRTSDDPSLYNRAARDTASEEVWLEVIRQHPEMKEWVAHNKTVPLTILAILADDADSKVRHMVAMKRKLSLELFEKLARDPDYSVRQRIAYNAKTPVSVLRHLCDDSEPEIASIAQGRIREMED